MYDSPLFNMRVLAMANGRPATDEHVYLLQSAMSLFNRALALGWLERAKATVLRQPTQLVDLNTAPLNITARYTSQSQSVPLDQIGGTLGRVHDFDAHFYPRSDTVRERWQSVAVARLQGTALPAVSLIQVGTLYCVQDGHHRISVARTLKQTEIDAEITVWEVAEPPRWSHASAWGLRPVSIKQSLNWRPT